MVLSYDEAFPFFAYVALMVMLSYFLNITLGVSPGQANATPRPEDK